MGFLFSILILINLIFKTTLKRNCFLLCLYFILIIIFSFLLFYQFSVVNVVLGIILIPAFTFIKTWKKHKKIIIIGIILVSFISVPVFIKYNFWSSNAIENQSIPAINFAKRVLTGEVNVNIDERFELNQANKFLIKENIIFGYGIGDVQDVLDGFYLSKKEDSRVYTEALKKHLNSHNNYAFLWLTGGLILLSAFLIQLFYAFNLSIKNKDWIFLFFLIIITLNLGFENVLSRISGLLFYVLFFNLFLHTTKLNKSY
jgi:O-antigen ligase